MPCFGADPSFVLLMDGSIRYRDEDGVTKIIRMGTDALIEKSSVYIARRAAGFVPALVASKPIKIHGRSWSIFRGPNLSPDGNTLYFGVPDSMVSSTIISRTLSDGQLGASG